MEAAEQLAAMRLSSGTATGGTAASLAAFSTARTVRSRGRGRGIPQPQTLKPTFCKTCYNNEKGKSTYLSHSTDAYNCPTKVKLNTMVEELLPPEVREQETEQEITDESADNSQVDYPAKYKYNNLCRTEYTTACPDTTPDGIRP